MVSVEFAQFIPEVWYTCWLASYAYKLHYSKIERSKNGEIQFAKLDLKQRAYVQTKLGL